MTSRLWSYLLIFTFGLSIVVFPLLEIGHAFLHNIKNEIHYHHADHHHTIEDHDLKHHQVDEMNEEFSDYNYISFLLNFFRSTEEDEFIISSCFTNHNTLLICLYTSINLCTLHTPPLG